MKLSGPQSERDKLWNAPRLAPTAKEDDHDIYEGEMAKLKRENDLLKNQLQRSLKELKAYQLKYPSPQLIDNDNDDDEGLSPWVTMPESMSPLLEAYDSRIYDMEQIIKRQDASIQQGKEQIEIISKENEELREQRRLNLYSDGQDNPHNLEPNSRLNSELVVELNERIDLLMDENSLLLEQKLILAEEVDKLQNQVQANNETIRSLQKNLKSTSTELQEMRKRFEMIEGDRDGAANEAMKYSESLGRIERENDEYRDQIAVLKQRCHESDLIVQELKKQLEQTSRFGEVESYNTVKRVKIAEERTRELQNLLHRKSVEFENISDANRKLRLEYQNTRQDAEGMLQVMSGLERQLNEYSIRETEVDRQAKESREKFEEALSIIEQCKVKEEKLKSEIERLLVERKEVALQRKVELEKVAENFKGVMIKQMEAHEIEMQSISKKNAELIFEREKALRENASMYELTERAKRYHEDEVTALQKYSKEIGEKLREITIGYENENAKRIEVQEQNKDYRNSIDKLRIQLENNRVAINQMEKNFEKDSSAIKGLLRDQQRENAEKSRIITKKAKELDDLKMFYNSKLANLEKKYNEELQLHHVKATEAHKLYQDLEASGHSSDMRVQMLVDQLKEKYLVTVSQLESKLRAELDTNQSLLSKQKLAEILLQENESEKESINSTIEEFRGIIKEQEEELVSARQTINDLTTQLSQSHHAREEGALRAARTIETLNSRQISEMYH